MSYTTDRFNTANQTASFNATSSVTINILTTVNVDVGSDQQLFSGDSVTINISDPKALFTLSDTISISPLLVVNLTNNSIPIPLLYNWLVNDSIPAYYNSTDPSHTFLFVGRYPITLTVTDAFGCADTFTRFVTINDNVDVYIYIPNVFTPNNDGLNEVFRIKYDVENTVILTGTIWNRWGGKIYDFPCLMVNGAMERQKVLMFHRIHIITS
jgi:PKD repeat protein